MYYFLDTEFNGFGGDLISLALVRQDGKSLYVAVECANPVEWVAQNVIPHIDSGVSADWVLPNEIPHKIAQFLNGDPIPTIITDWPDDIRYFCQAVITGPGEMAAIPQLQFQMYRVNAYPTTLPGAVQHNALWDALALRHLFSKEKAA